MRSTTVFVSRQAGVALISVLLVFALATVIAGEVMMRHYRDIRKTDNLINSKQAYLFALSGEQYARQILYRDFTVAAKKGEQADTLTDDWALNFPPFDIEGGKMAIEIHDLQGRFNINNLVDSSGAVNGVALNQFRQLQSDLSVEGEYSDTLIDWIDSNRTPLGDGAEDESYQQYLPANRPLADITELRMILGMTPVDYQKLAPFLTAIPKQLKSASFDRTKFNINTLNAKLLEAVAGLSAADASEVVNRQQRGGYIHLNDWLATPQGGALATLSDQLQVTTEFFEVVVTANYQQRICRLITQLHRSSSNGAITVIHRQVEAG